MQIWNSIDIVVFTWKWFRIIRLFTFWDTHTQDISNVALQRYRNNRKCLKRTYVLRKMQTFQVNNSIILRIENTKSWRCCFHINPNIQICISVTLRTFLFHRNIMLHSLDTQFFLFLIVAWTSEYVRSWWWWYAGGPLWHHNIHSKMTIKGRRPAK